MPPKKTQPPLSPDEKREKFAAKYDTKVVRLEDVQRNAIKLVAFQLAALENEAMSGLGYKGEAVGVEVVNKTAKLAAALNSLTEGERRLIATRKERAEKMTPEEELEAVEEFLKTLEKTILSGVLRRTRDWYNAQYPSAQLTNEMPDDPA